MTENDKAIEFLTRMGDLLYGRDWIVPLGREMEISPDLIFNWISRKTPLTMSDDVWPNVFYVLGQRGNRYQDFIDEVYFAFRDARKNQGKWWDDAELPQNLLVRPLGTIDPLAHWSFRLKHERS